MPTHFRWLASSVLLLLLVSGCSDDTSTTSISSPLEMGPYPVGITRVELFDPVQERVLLTEVWYPADESARGQEPAPIVYFLPEGLEFLGDNATLDLIAVLDAPIAPDGPFPLVVFSHGNVGIRYQNNFQMDYLASHGFIVAAPDHPGNTFFDSSAPQDETARARPFDLIYLLDAFTEMTAEPGGRFEGWVDTTTGFGATGHSFGAFTALAAADLDDRIRAVLPMALGASISDDFDTPTLLMLAGEDKTIGLLGNDVIRETYDALNGPRFLAEIPEAGHYSFTFACQIGLDGAWNGDGCGNGETFADGTEFEFVEDERVWAMVNSYSVALFGHYLKGIDTYETTLLSNIATDIATYEAEL